MYPFAQSVFPERVDEETKRETKKMFLEYTKNKKILLWRGNETLHEINTYLPPKKEENIDMDLRRVSAVADIQFGKNASQALLRGKIKIVKSKKTGKIRNIYVDERHVLSMRASDGLFTLKRHGAYLLHNFFRYPRLRVVIKEEAASFVEEGKNVFARFVVECDPELRPFDECLIVDENDKLLGAGRTLLNRDEMLSFNYGIAVKTREPIIQP